MLGRGRRSKEGVGQLAVPTLPVKAIDQLDTIAALARPVGESQVAIGKTKELRIGGGVLVGPDHAVHQGQAVEVIGS